MQVYTIGYEGWGADDWIATLQELGVRTVVDVRELPLSRRPGWSKKALAERLSVADLGYVHMRSLGTPAPMRHGLRDGSLPFSEFAPQFREILAHRTEDLDALLHLAESQSVALMCWEEDPAHCHRSLVAEALSKRAGDQAVEVVDIRRHPGASSG